MGYVGGKTFFVPRAVGRVRLLTTTWWNGIIYRCACKSVGQGNRFYPRIKILEPSAITIGNQCLISQDVKIFTEISGDELHIGNGVQINSGVIIDHSGGLIIGDKVLISEDSIVYTHDHGLDPRSEPRPMDKIIEQGAWIGARSIILPGCRKIGKNSVIGAGSVVTKDVPPFSVFAGNPASFVRKIKQS